MKYYSVDRIEENIATLIDDDENKVEIDVSQLLKEVKEGDILKFENGKYVLDKDETMKRKERILSLQNRIFKKK